MNLIQTQDKKMLVNMDFVTKVRIRENSEGFDLFADFEVEESERLGRYSREDQAKDTLQFLQLCMVRPEALEKCTNVPTQSESDEKFALLKNESPDDLFAELTEAFRSLAGHVEND